MRFGSKNAHREFLASQAALPRGFRCGTTPVDFTAREIGNRARMNLSTVLLDRPTADFAALYTRNAFVGAPVTIGRARLAEAAICGVVVNTKVSNVGVATGVADAEAVCRAAGESLGVDARMLLPASTGVIGWRLPVDEMTAAAPALARGLQADSVLPVAEGIMTTDLYPKIRRAACGDGSVVAIGKGAGMIEPHLATMLVFVLTDVVVPREQLRTLLARAADATFNRISIDTDTSTSDMVVALSSGRVPCPDPGAFDRALTQVCRDLADDIVRNGEGVHHVIRVHVTGAPDETGARGLGRAVVNSPLVKTAICGNDPNVGRLLMAIGKYLGIAGVSTAPDPLARAAVSVGGQTIFSNGRFTLSQATETAVAAHLSAAELYRSAPGTDGGFHPPVDYPPHEETVDIVIDLGSGTASSTVTGADLSHEYITENAAYRS